MPGRYNKVKTSIMKWRENNKENYNEYQRALMKRKYIMEKAKMELLAILRD
jgi:hypothetical protein